MTASGPRRRPLLALLLALALPAGAIAAPLSPVDCAGARCAAPANAVDLTVRDAAGLHGALRAARGGETIALAPGDYGALEFSGLAPAAPVTLRSADPADPARLSGMTLRDVSNLRLEGLVFDYAYEPGTRATGARPFQIFGGSDLAIVHATFDGDLASGTGSAADDGYAAGTGLFARDTHGLEIRGSLFHTLFRGAVLREIDDLAVVGNRVTEIRSDGLNFVAVQRALVEGNEITSFRRSPESGDHADLIQFWTNKTDRPSTQVTIRGNVLHAGGGAATQSIFMRNEEVDNGRAGCGDVLPRRHDRGQRDRQRAHARHHPGRGGRRDRPPQHARAPALDRARQAGPLARALGPHHPHQRPLARRRRRGQRDGPGARGRALGPRGRPRRPARLARRGQRHGAGRAPGAARLVRRPLRRGDRGGASARGAARPSGRPAGRRLRRRAAARLRPRSGRAPAGDPRRAWARGAQRLRLRRRDDGRPRRAALRDARRHRHLALPRRRHRRGGRAWSTRSPPARMPSRPSCDCPTGARRAPRPP